MRISVTLNTTYDSDTFYQHLSEENRKLKTKEDFIHDLQAELEVYPYELLDELKLEHLID